MRGVFKNDTFQIILSSLEFLLFYKTRLIYNVFYHRSFYTETNTI